jgi:hypothetical protein
MSERSSLGSPSLSATPADDRLDSWKEIAAYLRRDVTTVQRWEKREGMPVHRHLHDKMGSVYAFKTELDAWARSRNLRVADDEARAEGATDSAGPSLGRHSSLEAVAPGPGSAPARPVTTSAPSRRRARWRSVWSATAAAAVLAVIGALWWLERTDYFWRSPIADARFLQLTDLMGPSKRRPSRDGGSWRFCRIETGGRTSG